MNRSLRSVSHSLVFIIFVFIAAIQKRRPYQQRAGIRELVFHYQPRKRWEQTQNQTYNEGGRALEGASNARQVELKSHYVANIDS